MSGHYSPRRFYWPSQETISEYSPTDLNTAGSDDLATDGVLMCGKSFPRHTLLWTSTDLWSVTYIGGTFVYSTERIGRNCGIISPKAAVALDTTAYWMGVNKQFFLYDGYVKPLPCDVTDYVFGDFDATLAANWCWALANPQFGEVTWFYPSSAATSSNPIDRYVTYNYVENHWTFGNMDRTCGVTLQPGVSAAPVLIDHTGVVYDHETGSARTGMTPSLESGPTTVGEGDNVLRVQRIVPDDKTLGDVSATLYAELYPDASETSQTVTLADPTSVRLTGRYFRLKLTEAVQTAWRVGVVQLGGILGGRR